MNDKERTRIRLEELYRSKYSRRLSTTKNRNKVVEFLNTNLGIFLLSTLFISAFSWGYNQISGWQSMRAKRAETEKNLRLEINYRLRFISKLGDRFPSGDLNIIRTATYGFRPGTTQVPSHLLIYSPVFEEYGARSLASLLFELESVTSDTERVLVHDALSSSFEINNYFDRLLQIKIPSKLSIDDSGFIYFYELPQSERTALGVEVLPNLKRLERP